MKRHNLSRLPLENSNKTSANKKQKFKNYDIGYVHIDITEMRVEKQKLYLFVGIDRVCKYAYVELHTRMTQKIACDFLKNFIKDCAFKIHTILTDNGAQFTYALLAEHLQRIKKMHMFDQLCKNHWIKHKLTKFRHPWTNGQVEIMNKANQGSHCQKNIITRVFFQDEARFGRINDPRRCWARAGIRPL